MAESDNSDALMEINVKTPKTKKSIKVPKDATVDSFKVAVAKEFEVNVEQLCLIFAGKILKEGESLADHKITDGLTVHLVIKALNRTPVAATDPPPDSTTGVTQPNVAQTPLGLGGLGGLMGLDNLGMGSSNFMEMQQNIQRELDSNPDFMRNMMDNPVVQNLMSNPDVIRNIITSNPQMSEIMERNPEVAHMLNNPELMRQTMELARNPAMMQELIRTQDRAMSNLESMPGGFNALQRIHRDIQEPMMNAATGMNSNPFASLSQTSNGTSNLGQENNEPLPNPWASSGSTPSTTSTSTTPLNPTSGVFSTPGMQSLLTQMTQNPSLMSNMMQAPYMQSTLRTLSDNPQLAREVMNNNPMFAGNSALQDQVSNMMPQFLQQMQNPEMQGLMSNPRALQAISQIQSGLQTLQQEAPQVATMMMGSGLMPNVSSTSTNSTTTSTTTPSTATTANTTSTTSSSQDALNSFMTQMLSQMSTTTSTTTPTNNAQPPPEERYATQLQQLTSMGFINREANLNALVATFGDLNGAINRLLESGQDRPN